MTEPELIAELVRCCDTLRRMPFPRHGAPPAEHVALGAHGPEPIHERWDYASDRTRLTVTRPSAEDISHFDLWWPIIINGVANHDMARTILVGRCWGLSWRKIGRHVGCDYRTARARYDGAIAAIGREVNRIKMRRMIADGDYDWPGRGV